MLSLAATLQIAVSLSGPHCSQSEKMANTCLQQTYLKYYMNTT